MSKRKRLGNRLPRFWAGNITTVPEFLEQRFDRGTRRLMGALLLGTLAFNLLPFVLYSGGVAMSAIFHLPEQWGLSPHAAAMVMAAVIAAIGCGYVLLGGMKAVALSDTLYGAGLLVAGLAIPVLGLRALGDGNIGAGWACILTHQAPKLNPVGGPMANVPFTTLFTGMMLLNLFYWCTNQLIVQRSFGASSFAEAQKGVLATAGLKLLGPLYLAFPGIIALELLGPAAVGNGDFAYARLVDAVLPGWATGFFAAVLLGSIISSFNGGLHSAATLFSLDLFGAWLRPDADAAAKLRAGKRFGLVIAAVAVVSSQWLGDAPEGIFTLMKRIMAAFKLPLLTVVLAAILSRRVPAWAAKAAMLGGVGTHFLLEWLLSSGIAGFTLHWLHVGALNTVLLGIGLALAGWLAPTAVRPPVPAGGPPVASIVTDLTPWRGLKVASLLLVLVSVGIYAGLW